MRPGLWGRVFPNFNRINPERRPTILFAPGVRESIWFAEQFTANGVPAAHVDGDHVWLDGQLRERGNDPNRDPINEIRDRSEAGDITVVCNRYVLREGIDFPWLSHGILATVYGSLASYLQSVGRLLRAYPGVSTKTLQDHGGNWHRHGSVNADRDWNIGDTAAIHAARRNDRLRDKRCRRCRAALIRGNPWCPACSFLNEVEARLCPQCFCVLVAGKCKACGFDCRGVKRSRPLVLPDGTLKHVAEDLYPSRRYTSTEWAAKKWERMYWRSLQPAARNRTFAQAAALFAMENKWSWPARDLPFMPKQECDYYLPVNRCPQELLYERPADNQP
jgi:hypothetical protein